MHSMLQMLSFGRIRAANNQQLASSFARIFTRTTSSSSNMSTNNLSLSWTKIVPRPDPTHGAPCERSSHGVSLVHNGSRLIVYGGEHIARTPIESNQACWAVDLPDATSDGSSWRWIDSAPPDRIAHAQAVHHNKVYIFGGRQGIAMSEKALNDLWVLDCSGAPGTETWSVVETSGVPPEERSFHKMICIGSCLYVFGGCGASGRLNDLHQLDLTTMTWTSLGNSQLKGRGGPNLLPLSSGSKVAVIAGFAGEETKDGHQYCLAKQAWDDSIMLTPLENMRPRSVCVSAAFPSAGVAIIFGGEVDPSDRGHEGAGGFENDLVLLDEKTGAFLESRRAEDGAAWPEQRGWTDSDSIDCGDGTGKFVLFGGLSGDDVAPKRLNDLWCLTLKK